mmetsp:Transcript_7722/g.22834  ORF Transcript_7722/g.22834 Transcript_7722/m.22834 type:complete len:256 (+) Transcript_7722:3552-4319(+)
MVALGVSSSSPMSSPWRGDLVRGLSGSCRLAIEEVRSNLESMGSKSSLSVRKSSRACALVGAAPSDFGEGETGGRGCAAARAVTRVGAFGPGCLARWAGQLLREARSFQVMCFASSGASPFRLDEAWFEVPRGGDASRLPALSGSSFPLDSCICGQNSCRRSCRRCAVSSWTTRLSRKATASVTACRMSQRLTALLRFFAFALSSDSSHARPLKTSTSSPASRFAGGAASSRSPESSLRTLWTSFSRLSVSTATT